MEHVGWALPTSVFVFPCSAWNTWAQALCACRITPEVQGGGVSVYLKALGGAGEEFPRGAW